MAERALLYYITDCAAFPGDERTRRLRLLDKIAEAARCGVDYIQLREKDMPTRELESLAREAVEMIHQLSNENRKLNTGLLINSRADVALTSGADGVHLRADDVSPREVRDAWHRSGDSSLLSLTRRSGQSCRKQRYVRRFRSRL
jgi:thiamine-phosphate pyrophosphorylase